MARSRPLDSRTTRTRDYKAEYARRVASATARGKSRAEARGHAAESTEKKARRARTWGKYGVSPEKLAKLRKAAAAHVVSALGSVAKGRISNETIAAGVKLMTGERLQEIIETSGADLLAQAKESYFDAAGRDPEMEDDVIEAERNPLWYHGGY